MQKAVAQTPAKNFDGSRSGSYGGVGELEDDHKHEVRKSDDKKKDDKKAADKKDNKAEPDNKIPVPQENHKQGNAPAMPPVAIPEPGDGVSKGRN